MGSIPFFFSAISVWFFSFPRVLFGDFTLHMLFGELFLIAGFFSVLPSFAKRGIFAATPLASAVFVFIAVLAASTVFSVNRTTSFWGFLDRQDGFVSYLFLWAFFLTARALLRDQRSVSAFLRFVLVLGFCEVGLVFWQFGSFLLKFGPASPFGLRPAGTFGNPDFLAPVFLFLIIFAALLFVQEYRNKRRSWQLAALFFIPLAFLAMFVVNSRASLAGAVLGALYLFLVYRREIFVVLRRKRAMVAAVIACGIVPLFLFLFFRGVSGSLLLHMLDTESLRTRLLFWEAGFSAFLERPLLGWGLGNFIYAFDTHFPVGFAPLAQPGFIWSDFAHNAYLDIAVRTGALGLFGFLALFAASAAVLFRLRTLKQDARLDLHIVWALLIGYAVNLFFIFNFFSMWIMFFLFLALLDASFLRATRLREEPAQKKFRATIQTLPFVGLGFVLVVVFATSIAPFLRSGTLLALGNSVHALPQKILFFSKSVEESAPFSNFNGLVNLGSAFLEWQKSSPETIFSEKEETRILGERVAAASYRELSRNDTSLPRFIAGIVHEFGALRSGNPRNLILADTELFRVHEQSPNREIITWSLAEVKAARGEYDAARALYQDAISLNPKRGESYGRLALLHIASGDREAAEALFAEARRLGFSLRQQFVTPMWFSDPFAMNGDWEKSAQFWQEAVRVCEEVAGEKKDEECKLFASYAQAALEKLNTKNQNTK